MPNPSGPSDNSTSPHPLLRFITPRRLLIAALIPILLGGFWIYRLSLPLMAEVRFIKLQYSRFHLWPDRLPADPHPGWNLIRKRLDILPPPVSLSGVMLDRVPEWVLDHLRLEHVVALSICEPHDPSARLRDNPLRWLARMDQLQRLELPMMNIQDQDLESLAGLKRLKTLEINGGMLKGGFVAHLPDSIEQLYLQLGVVGYGGAEAFASLHRLKDVQFVALEVHPLVVQALLTKPSIRSIMLHSTGDCWPYGVDLSRSPVRTLQLDGIGADSRLFDDLSRAPSVDELNFSRIEVDSQAVAKLAMLKSLRVLRVTETELDDDVFTSISPLGNLQELYLSSTPVPSRALADLVSLPKLKRLNLDNIRVDDSAVDHLLKIPALEHLDLVYSRITDKSFVRLVRDGRLRSLNAGGIAITSKAMDALLKKTTLQELQIDYSLVNPELLEAIKKVNPDLKINEP